MAEVPSHAELHQRNLAARERQRASVTRVSELLSTQRRLGQELGKGVVRLQEHGQTLQRLDEAERDPGMLRALMRPFTARQTALTRRSAAEGLVAHYEAVSGQLRQALAFLDDLRVTVLDLQHEVERLHTEQIEARRARAALDEEIATCNEELAARDPRDPADALEIERLRFRIHDAQQQHRLAALAEQLAAGHIGPARQLRDTAMELQEQMARYATSAGFAVDAAGARVQVLGMLADAPTVVADLHASVRELGDALDAAQTYVVHSQRLIGAVLPELAAQLQSRVQPGWMEDPEAFALAEAEVDRMLTEEK